MKTDEFTKMSMCNFVQSEEEVFLKLLAKEYHTRCEAYDAVVCSGRSEKDNCAMPVNGYELRKINHYSRGVFNSIVVNNPNVEPKAIKQAISRYSH